MESPCSKQSRIGQTILTYIRPEEQRRLHHVVSEFNLRSGERSEHYS